VDPYKVGVVLIHGFLSSPDTWRHLVGRIRSDPQLDFAEPLTFQYSTPPMTYFFRRIPNFDDIAESLRLYLTVEAGEFPELVLIAHSQGGLVAQRYLQQMISEGRAPELQRIQQIHLLACPNNGSQLWLSARRWFMPRNAQERQLRPLDAAVARAQRAVLTGIVHAREVSPTTCPIEVKAYAGESDGVVPPASGRGPFPDGGVLPGDHFTIIRTEGARHRTFTTLKHELRKLRPVWGQDAIVGTAPVLNPGGAKRVPAWQQHVLITPEKLLHVDRTLDRLVTEIADDSYSATSALAVWGEGGLGKTAVTYAALRALPADAFTHIVWASARNTRFSTADPGIRSVESIYWHDLLSMVAGQLDCPLPPNQALWERDLQNFLAGSFGQTRILLVVDNLEFFSAADELIGRLRRLGFGPPHKIVATTRWKSAADDLNVRNIEMRPFTEQQTYDLVQHHAQGSSSDLADATNDDLLVIFRTTEGNPFLIKLVTLSYVASGKSLPRIVDELTDATRRGLGQAVRNWLFDRSLDELSRRFSEEETLNLLFAFCATARGGSMTYDELRAEEVAPTDEEFDHLLEAACRLGLVRPSNLNARYSIHSLLYEYTCPLAQLGGRR
jgi:pimeloyl-ACP methyl ester carboxylesterase